MQWKLQGQEKKYFFNGAYGHDVQLTMFPNQIDRAGHVVILAHYKGQLLFTKHKERGLEWPGGKVEKGESELQAAIRELLEETGGQALSMWLIGQYKVYHSVGHFFVKNIYAAQIDFIGHNGHNGVDTDGYVLLPNDVQPTLERGFSPLVTDSVFQYVQEELNPSGHLQGTLEEQ